MNCFVKMGVILWGLFLFFSYEIPPYNFIASEFTCSKADTTLFLHCAWPPVRRQHAEIHDPFALWQCKRHPQKGHVQVLKLTMAEPSRIQLEADEKTDISNTKPSSNAYRTVSSVEDDFKLLLHTVSEALLFLESCLKLSRPLLYLPVFYGSREQKGFEKRHSGTS